METHQVTTFVATLLGAAPTVRTSGYVPGCDTVRANVRSLTDSANELGCKVPALSGNISSRRDWGGAVTSGDDASQFSAFYRATYSLVLATCSRRLGDHTAAEDATAEVFRIAWQHFSEEELTVAWLYTTVRNVVGNEWRRQGRVDHLFARLVQEHLPDDETHSDAMEVREAVLTLRLSERELLYMAYWEDLTGKEIAEVLGISPAAVWVRLSRARESLRNALLASSTVRRGDDG
ncbi:RNA polymerase sigma factor [Microbacterium aurum]